jgi:hypothetical protein
MVMGMKVDWSLSCLQALVVGLDEKGGGVGLRDHDFLVSFEIDGG